MKRSKNVFPTLLFAIAVCVILSLGCSKSVQDEICEATCTQTGGEFVESGGDNPYHWGQLDHYCVCRYKLQHFNIKDKASSKQDAVKIPDGTSIDGTMVQR